MPCASSWDWCSLCIVCPFANCADRIADKRRIGEPLDNCKHSAEILFRAIQNNPNDRNPTAGEPPQKITTRTRQGGTPARPLATSGAGDCSGGSVTVGKAGEGGRGGRSVRSEYLLCNLWGGRSNSPGLPVQLGVCRGACGGSTVLLDTDVVTLLYQVG
jgi:hypothetical protein